MATLTSHVLDSVNGTHAAGVGITLYRIAPSGGRTALFNAATDAGGRLRETVALEAADAGIICELVFQVAEYFARQGLARSMPLPRENIFHEAAFRFAMPDPGGAYHIPMMMAPNSCSVWCSS